MIASMFPFFNNGIRVLEVTSTNSAFPFSPRIFSVIAFAISTSNPCTVLLSISIIPNNRVSYLTPQMISLVDLLRSKISSFANPFPLHPASARKAMPKRKIRRIFLNLRIFFLLSMIDNFTDKLLCSDFIWIFEKVSHISAIFQYFSVSHEDDTIRNFFGKAHFMRHDNH